MNKEITVNYINSNIIYDIYAINGLENIEENEETFYHEELRNTGSNEEYILSLYLN